jgi:plastocyanin
MSLESHSTGLTLRMRSGVPAWAGIFIGAALAAAVACGSGESSTPPTTPTTPTAPTTPPPSGSLPTAVTITIGTDGQVTPASVTIAAGGRVTMINNHNQPHDMSSDPHPEHTECPEINQIGFLSPGQSRTSGNLNTRRACGFHDHNQPSDPRYQGRIVIQ